MYYFFLPDFILAHQLYIFAFSPELFFAFLRKSVTEPLQLAPERFTRPGLLLPFTLPSAKFSVVNSFAFAIAGAVLEFFGFKKTSSPPYSFATVAGST